MPSRKTPFRLIKNFSATQYCWMLLLLFALAMEVCGLHFQYDLHLPVCVNCVYERAFFLGFLLAALVGLLNPKALCARMFASLLLLLWSGLGLRTAIEHYLSSNPGTSSFGQTCPLAANFPDWLKLDQWVPFMFNPAGGACMPLPWELLGFSMPAWLIAIFSCGLAAAVLIIISQFINTKEDSIDK